MRKHTITALAAALCLLCMGVPVTGIPEAAGFSVSAADTEKLTSGILTYTIENDCIIITGCEETEGTVEIPAEIDGKPVTRIGPTAFYGLKLTSVTIPEGVTSIGSGAFWHCSGLKAAALPSTLTTIESYAFNDCALLEDISIPESVTLIGKEALSATAWMTAQQAQSPCVVVNGILIDATAVINQELDAVAAEKERLKTEGAELTAWRKPGKRSSIITNQVGYFPNLAKRATLVTDAQEPVAFELVSADGKVAYSGESKPLGLDNASGDNVHTLDFSEYTEQGTYTLKTADSESRPFMIGVTETYSGLMYDALNYFYQNRSGVPIEAQYITSGNADELARDAGHAPDVATIQQVWGYEGSSGTQDVTGGWYDAGDHGKYVVNGGISLWLMQNMYERAKAKGTTAALDDGTMKIPENGNEMPDLLDEARFEMEWMLTMIVQDGDYAGMAYHKVHDMKWTGIGTNPAQDKLERYLMPPSTAATLNLAACGAQAYRLWKELDPDFAEKCLTASKNAYEAAKSHPEVYAPNKEHGGGGAYGDANVTDEFYWAACELFTATGDAAYYDDLKGYDGAFEIPAAMDGKVENGLSGCFDWGYTAALGSLTLLLHPDAVSEEEAGQVKESLLATADRYAAFADTQGYGVPYQGYLSEGGYQSYVWGSNSFVADDAIILAYAYDASEDIKYLNGVVGAMDYILGRNALDFSYVTGYGAHSAQYPHHRWWAKQNHKDFPKAPCGVLTGGANANMEDPVIQLTELVKGESPTQLCYIDESEAYSVNECAVNWNSPLVWVTGYLCEQNGGIAAGQSSGGAQLEEPKDPADVPLPEIHFTVPDGVTAIGEQIFGSVNSRVFEVVIPDSVTKIGKEAFYRCSNLTDITIPETIEEVGDSAFGDTPWLKEKLKETPLLMIGSILIDGTTASGDVVIPEGVTRILGSAFKMNKDITSVTIPEGVTSIGESAFYKCEGVTEIQLPESLKTIGQSAFAGSGLTELTIPEGVREIGAEAFINCLSLPEATILGKDTRIAKEAFGCTSTFTANGQYSYIFVHTVREDFVVKCYQDSTADKYAADTGLQTAYLDGAPETALALGDVNGDKTVNASDAAQVLIAAAKAGGTGDSGLTAAQNTAADVTADGEVNASDAAVILQYAAYAGGGGTDSFEAFLKRS